MARLNDYEIKVVKVQGEFVWHQHDDTDELFLVLDGELVIDLPDGPVTLGPRDVLTIPKGVRHRPRAERETSIVLIEPAGVVNTGDAGGPMTVGSALWSPAGGSPRETDFWRGDIDEVRVYAGVVTDVTRIP